jgi:hypothetical protein
MAKHKSITHLPPAPSTPAPRLAAQLFTAFGELLAVAAAAVGVVTIAGWLHVVEKKSDVRPAPVPGVTRPEEKRHVS